MKGVAETLDLGEFLDEDLFVSNLKAREKSRALEEMVHVLHEKGRVHDAEILLDTLLRREGLGSTGIGKGIAIPHSRSLAVPKLSLLIARSAKGVEYDSVDRKPVHLFFLILAPPQDRANLYLPVLGRIVDVIKSVRVRRRLLEAPDFLTVRAILSEPS